MRVVPFPASSSQLGRCLAAILALWLAGMAAVGANEIAANAVSGFAEQQIEGVTLTATLGSSAVLVAADFSVNVKMSTMAAFDTSPGGVAPAGELDALPSFVAGTVPLQPVEHFIGNASPGMSLSAGEWILRQLDATAPGVAGGFDLAHSQATEFLDGRYFVRHDGYATPNPAAYPLARSRSGKIPSSRVTNGNQVPAASLSFPIGTPRTPWTDLVTGAILDGESLATLARDASDEAVTGNFRIGGAAAEQPAVSTDFDLVERLVVHSWDAEVDITNASNAFALDIGDATGRSVFGPFLGANPSVTRLSSAATGP